MSGTYQESSLGWQIRQSQQRLGEWFDYQMNRLDSSTEQTVDWGVNLPDWVGRGLAVVLLTATALWLAWSAFQRLRPYLANWRSLPPFRRRGQPKDANATALSVSALLQQVQAEQQAGNYREACRLLYLAMLERLHETAAIAPNPSRTNGEYLDLIAQLPQPRPYQLLTRVHERLYFGGTAISVEVFQRCRRAYQEITKS